MLQTVLVALCEGSQRGCETLRIKFKKKAQQQKRTMCKPCSENIQNLHAALIKKCRTKIKNLHAAVVFSKVNGLNAKATMVFASKKNDPPKEI